MHYLVATDSFKGCLSAADVAHTLADALRRHGAEVVALPLSDGGEGMLDTFAAALSGRMVRVAVHDPLMRPIEARYALTPDGTALVETAEACGLCLLDEAERNPLRATTYGVGELIAHARRSGCRRFVVGLGGSGTSDAGRGMLQALTDSFAPGGAAGEGLAGAFAGCRFTLAADVRNPLCGPEGAACTFGPQKGADPAMVARLDTEARRFAEASARRFGFDCSGRPGAGAAGGLGYAFMQYLGAEASSGADLLLRLTGFDRLLAEADVVITGEGSADRQTLMGKLPRRVLEWAQRQGVPVWLVAGRVADEDLLRRAGFARVAAVTPVEMPLGQALCAETARANLCHWADAVCGAPDGRPAG